MSTPTNAFSMVEVVGDREDLQDLIYNVDPTETPFVTRIAGQGSASNTYHEWQTDILEAPDTSNAVIEGLDAEIDAVTPTERIGNRTQIMDKTAVITGTLEATDRAGRDAEMGYQLMKKSLELRRDMEAIITGSQGSAAGDRTNPRLLGALENTISTNVNSGATYSGGGWVDPNWAAISDGTQRPFAEADLKALIRDVWTSSTSSMVTIMCGPFNKQAVTTSLGGGGNNIQRRQESDTRKITDAVDLYQSDFGSHGIIPNRFQRDRTLFVLDNTMHTITYLRPFRSWPLAKLGDTERRQILVECTYCAKNEKANGKYADLDDS